MPLDRPPYGTGSETIGYLVDIGLRFIMAAAFLYLTNTWLSQVGTIIQSQTTEHHLSDTVLVALLTTTTINVLGLLYFVANYLFPKKPGGDSSTPIPPAPPSIKPPA